MVLKMNKHLWVTMIDVKLMFGNFVTYKTLVSKDCKYTLIFTYTCMYYVWRDIIL